MIRSASRGGLLFLRSVVLVALVLARGVEAAPPAAPSPPVDCLRAAQSAEREAGLPEQLLAAIGRVESGRPDGTGRIIPWPYTVDVDGRGYFFPSAAAAAAFVRMAGASGARSIDVGCFQISLLYHPEAFPALETAFDPLANARYAAHFLVRLRQRAAGWQEAVALYHSALPAAGAAYWQQVLFNLHGGAAASRLFGIASARIAPPADWLAASAPENDPVVILRAPAAARVRVVQPGEMPASIATRLPKVVTPS